MREKGRPRERTHDELKGIGGVVLLVANKLVRGASVGPRCKDRLQERGLAGLDGRGVRRGCALCTQRTGQLRKCPGEPVVKVVDLSSDSRRRDDQLTGLEVVHERREVREGLHDAIE